MNEAEKLIERFGSAKSVRMQSDSLREEAFRYAWASQKDLYNSSRDTSNLPETSIYNSTATLASFRAASGIFSYLMPVGEFWFTFTPQDPALAKDEMVQRWINEAVAILHDEIWRSNFQREMFATIRSIVVAGFGTISVVDMLGGLSYLSHYVGDVCFETNSKGEIDTVFKSLYWTPRQVIQEFGDKTPAKILKDAEKPETASKKYEFVHCVYPRNDYDYTKIGPRGKRFVGKYIYVDEKEIVDEDAYDELPYCTGRYATEPGRTYPYSPVIENLPDIRMLNTMSKANIIGIEKITRPPLILEDDSAVGQPNTSPDGIIYIRPGAMEPKPMDIGFDAQAADLFIQRMESKVKDAMFNNLFQTLADHRNMSATEVIGRREEALVMLSPTIVSISKELFDPLISRSLNICIRQKRIPEAPVPFDYDIKYLGRLALAMSGAQSDAAMAHLAMWAPYMEAFPELRMAIKATRMFKETGMNKGVKVDWLATDEEMAAMMQEQSQAIQSQQEVAMAEQGSKAMLNISKAMNG